MCCIVQCGDPYTASSSGGEEEGRVGEFLVLRVEGQSFMLHQIRKMIGALIKHAVTISPTLLPKAW